MRDSDNHRIFEKNMTIDHLNNELYSMVFQFDNQFYSLPMKLNKYSSNVSFTVYFDGPKFCRESYVRIAETPAQAGNLQQALQRYLLASHLFALDDEASRCRDTQPRRLQKAKIERGIQLATFRGSPFLPPEDDPDEWETILGEAGASNYRSQIRKSDAIRITEARQNAKEQGDYDSAARLNSDMLAKVRTGDQSLADYAAVGMTIKRLEADQEFLDARARAVAETPSPSM